MVIFLDLDGGVNCEAGWAHSYTVRIVRKIFICFGQGFEGGCRIGFQLEDWLGRGREMHAPDRKFKVYF